MYEQDSARPGVSDAPIYDRLVAERGDVPAEVGRAAAVILREVDQAFDFSSLRVAF
ncbi:hypothetical protein ACF07Y_46320 [Streptomyces sp. NPDC016566]|uniref:hypothetical protein n=1 Tax=Streptomyces sp. NPDC016566 TaxID=3364967 RepID=UPI0036FD30CB